ncbi:DUF1566 domain-containing protein [Arcobacteraceae bacterium]|jgi:hypothetical protein|nr:DUF1566 domain-containing protein [Arcobacteraceae bacterium]
MKIFTLLCISFLALSAAKLTKSGNYVIDDKNKLMWQDTKANTKILVTQDQAIEYCEKLTLSGFTDWELPTVKNVETIIDKKRVRAQLMINKAFKNVRRDNYWLKDRTWLRNFGEYGYYVFFKSGSIYYQNRTYPKYVRCVRKLK